MQKNERHCTGIFLYRYDEKNSRYEIALIQSEKFRHHLTGALLWTIPGGKIEEKDSGITLEDKIISCAKRETLEELSVEIDEVRYYAELNSTKTGREIGYKDPETQFYFYECIAKPSSYAFVLSPEIEQVQWFAIDALPEQMAEDVRQLLNEIGIHTEKYFHK